VRILRKSFGVQVASLVRWKLSLEVQKERCANWVFISSERVHILWMSKTACGSFWLNITSFCSWYFNNYDKRWISCQPL